MTPYQLAKRYVAANPNRLGLAALWHRLFPRRWDGVLTSQGQPLTGSQLAFVSAVYILLRRSPVPSRSGLSR